MIIAIIEMMKLRFSEREGLADRHAVGAFAVQTPFPLQNQDDTLCPLSTVVHLLSCFVFCILQKSPGMEHLSLQPDSRRR